MSPWITDEDPFSRFIRHLIFQMYFRYKKISCTSHIFKHVSLCSVFLKTFITQLDTTRWKSEISLIWCISSTNNVKSCKKNQWNSSNGQLHWFSIDFLWKCSIMGQNYANANVFFSIANIFLPDVSFHMACLDTS